MKGCESSGLNPFYLVLAIIAMLLGNIFRGKKGEQ